MSFLSDIFLPDTAQTSSEQADNYARQQAEFNRRLAARQTGGDISQEQVDRYMSGQTDPLLSQDAAAWEGAQEGAAEGWNNVLDAPGRAVGAITDSTGQALAGVLKNIPFWLWLVAAGALFVWMGGLSLLKGRLAR
jgi:hypothetical protein